MPVTVERYHDISCGHRVVGHEGKCRHLHGHNYRMTFTCQALALDDVGRVIDFSVIKERLCQWLEDNWDHKMLLWEKDDLIQALALPDAKTRHDNRFMAMTDSIVAVPFNPTAENMGMYLMRIAPNLLTGTGVRLVKVRVEETRKCSAEVSE